MKSQKIKFVTDAIRFEDVQLDSSKSFSSEDNHFKYSLSVVFEKTNLKEIERINKVVKDLTEDNSTETIPVFGEGSDPNCFYLNVSSKDMPVIVDGDLSPILNVDEIYNGCPGRASITACSYESLGALEIVFELNAILKFSDR